MVLELSGNQALVATPLGVGDENLRITGANEDDTVASDEGRVGCSGPCSGSTSEPPGLGMPPATRLVHWRHGLRR